MKQGKIIFDKNIEVIGESAFEGLSTLTSITIPKSVKTIENNAFKNCDNLEEIFYKGTVEEFYKINIEEFYDTSVIGKLVACKDGEIIIPNYLTFTALEDGEIGFYVNPDASVQPTIEYSYDKQTWNTLTEEYVSVPSGSNLYCRGINTNGISPGYYEGNHNHFISTGRFNISGDIMTLIDYKHSVKEMIGTMRCMFGYEDGTNYVDIVDASNLILSAETLTSDCYQNMFDSCANMVYPPQIKATTLAPYCYYKMFYECTSLITAPELPATELASECYRYMFQYCTSLTTAPELPATELANACYHGMFDGCTSLTTAPELPATELASECYNHMFYGCTKLNNIKCLATNISASYCTYNWVKGVSSTGTFVKHPDITSWSTGASGIPSGWEVEDAYAPYITFTAQEDNSSIGLAELSSNQILEYSTDTFVWNTFDTSTNISLNNNDNVYVRGMLSDNTGTNYTQFEMSGKIAASGSCNALWNYEDLNAPLKESCGASLFLDCTALTIAPKLPAVELAESCYNGMFRGCTNLTTAPTLPATTLASDCYYGMFDGCASLTTVPELPATTLAASCYDSMFYNCQSLTIAPKLPATELAPYCYQYMFQNCTSLTTVPELPATTLVEGCYKNMFEDCESLNYIKCLAMDISASNCIDFWMSNVSSIGTFIKHPNTTWSTGNSGIPSGWIVDVLNYITFTSQEDNSSIGLAKLSTNQQLEYKTDTTTWNTFNTSTNISLNKYDKVYVRGILSADNTSSNYTQFKMTGKIAASGDCNTLWNCEDLNTPLKQYCGYYMFSNCTSLTAAPELPATELAEYCYYGMFQGCTTLTTAPELPAMTLVPYCYHFMFGFCTSLTIAPKLPATELARSCYSSMFNDCQSLTTAPELPAVMLAPYCYNYMFNECTKLNYIKCLAIDISATNCTFNWVQGVSSIGTFVKHPDMNSWTTGTSGIPTGWEVEDAEIS